MIVRRGEIFFVDLEPTKGREQYGRRPVLVLSIDAINKLPLVASVVVGTKGDNISRDYDTNVRVSAEESGLPMETVFMGFQLRSLDASRFPDQPSGRVKPRTLARIERAVRYCLGL